MKLSLPLLLSLALHAVLVTGWQLDALKITKAPETIEIRIASQVREEVQEQPLLHPDIFAIARRAKAMSGKFLPYKTY